MYLFNGIGTSIDNLSRLSNAKTRSICPENFSGEKGQGARIKLSEGIAAHKAKDLGEGWKVNPYVRIAAGETFVLAHIQESGCIQQMWFTPTGEWRNQILRIYWDGSEYPSVECPIGDFFASGLGTAAQISSLAVCVNPGSALNCYWQMPFRKSARITLENRNETDITVYYQINYCLAEIPEDMAYFHAQFRRVNPLPYKEVYTILDGVEGKGHYVGTHICWGSNSNGWWGEGEIKFYMDGDSDYPTICGTGTEDYFCGSYDFMDQKTKQYKEFTTPYAGMPQVIRPDGAYISQERFSLYRWHITDPIRFENDLKVTIQALGWRTERGYLPLQDDISSVAYWYQTLPSKQFSTLLSKEFMELN